MATTDTQRHTADWRRELRTELQPVPSKPAPELRCGCGHTRRAHAGKMLGRHGLRDPLRCSVMICGCEIFRSEADR